MKFTLSILSVLFCCVLGQNEKKDLPTDNPKKFPLSKVPQFVTLTFDDAVTIINYPRTYKPLFNLVNKKSGCPIRATYFVSHEYTNYVLINDLHRRGHEIAVHSITHRANTAYWKRTDKDLWIQETQGMRELIAKLAEIPAKDIKGFRSPFLQTAGNITFQVLKDQKFLYDCSMPTLRYSNPELKDSKDNGPLWPYKLDSGYKQDCQIAPCPNATFGGLWLVPMNDYWKLRKIDDESSKLQLSPCAMADFCLPWPTTANDTQKYFMENFKRHYTTNKAPFPIYLHESWFQVEERRKGFFAFLNDILKKDDVYMTTIEEVLNWMDNPVQLGNFTESRCVKKPPQTKCPMPGTTCTYHKLPQFWDSTRTFVKCGPESSNSTCPQSYPWVFVKDGPQY